MKRILMIFSFVSASLFSFCQTNVNYNFTKSFALTEWYEVKSAISYDLVTYKCSQDVLDISENLFEIFKMSLNLLLDNLGINFLFPYIV